MVDMRPGYFLNHDGEKQVQRMSRRIMVKDCTESHKEKKKLRLSYEAERAYDATVDEKHKLAKGLKTILEERGLWPSEDPYRVGKDFRADCKKDEKKEDGRCCARHLLGLQEDFMAQESALAEVVKGAGHIFELYPKFHCETNWIERYWGAVKREARLNCEYTLSALRVNLPVFCDRVSPVDAVPIKIRRFHNRCWRYIDAYSKLDSSGNPIRTMPLLPWLTSSHRGR